jgi:hypothetical protein
MYRFLLFLLFISTTTFGQKISKKDKKVIGYLQSEVSYLASDELKGRRAGDPGEILAANFIADKFKEIGLTPKGKSDNSSFYQVFDIYDGKYVDSSSYFFVNGVKSIVGTDIFPLSNSPKGNYKATIIPAIHEDVIGDYEDEDEDNQFQEQLKTIKLPA